MLGGYFVISGIRNVRNLDALADVIATRIPQPQLAAIRLRKPERHAAAILDDAIRSGCWQIVRERLALPLVVASVANRRLRLLTAIR